MAQLTLAELQQAIDDLVQKTGKTGINAFNITNLQIAEATLRGLQQEFREMSGDISFIRDTFKETLDQLSRQNTYLSAAKKSLRSISSISSQVVEHRKGETTLTADQIKKLQHRGKLEFEQLQVAIKRGSLRGADIAELQNALNQQEAFNKALENTARIEEKVNKDIGLAGVGLKSFANLMSQIGFGDLSKPFSDAIGKTKEARRQIELNNEAIERGAEEYSKNKQELRQLSSLGRPLTAMEKARKTFLQQQNREIQETKKGLEAQSAELGTQTSKYRNIASSLKEQVTLVNATDFVLGKVVQAFFALNKASVDFQRLTGQNESIQAGLNLRFATSVDYLQTATELTQKLGVNANNVFRSDTIAAAAEFKNLLGLSGDEAGNLATLAEATGTSLDKNTEQLVDQVGVFNKSNRSAVSQGKVLKDVANTSEAITVSLGANPAKLAAAASQAARLGMQLKDVDAIASSLLDFESSIEAELEAQLLTGKQINLAKAREYALTNQLDKLGQEIFENTADIAEYGQMNRIAQEAYAKSLGMTRDQLARTAYLRALEAGMTEDQAKAAANVSLEDMKRVEAQESLNKSIEKMAQALAGPVDLLASMLGHTWAMYGVMTGMVGIVGVNLVNAFVGVQGQISKAVKWMRTLSLLSLRTAIGNAWAAAFSSPAALISGGVVGLAVGAGLTAAIMSSFNKGDDIVSPGYGQRTLFGPEGVIALNNKDTVIAGTDLFPEAKQSSLTTSSGLSLEPLVAEIRAMKDELKGVLTAIRDKEGNVYLDTDLVGKALVVGSTSI